MAPPASPAPACAARLVGQWVLRETLGQGSFGEVRFCVHAETRRQAAAKVCSKATVGRGQGRKQLEREIATMKALDHPSVLRLYEVLESTRNFYLILEFAPGGELFNRIQDHKRFTDAIAREYFQQLILGVRYCHKQGVVHRDLKPQNLLLTAANRLKIADFGFSKFQTPDTEGRAAPAMRLQTQCGTPNYAAPEIFLGGGYDGFCADVWSCGVILYVMLCGHVPFRPAGGGGLRGVIMAIVQGNYVVPPEVSPEARSLITSILVTDPEARATVPGIIAHPWFAGGKDIRGLLAECPRIDVSDCDIENSILRSEEELCSPVDAVDIADGVGPPEDDEEAGSPCSALVPALAPGDHPAPASPGTRGGYSSPAAGRAAPPLDPMVQSFLGTTSPVQFDQLGRRLPEAGGAAAAARLAMATPEQRAASQLEAGRRSQHNFVRKRWHMPRWCFHCAKFIYGVGRQGFECTRCGCPVHRECEEEATRESCCEAFTAAGSPERLATEKQRVRRNTVLSSSQANSPKRQQQQRQQQQQQQLRSPVPVPSAAAVPNFGGRSAAPAPASPQRSPAGGGVLL